MDDPVEEEKKPFEAESMAAEEEVLPDPDKQLMLHQRNGRVWLIKVRSVFFVIPLDFGIQVGIQHRSQSISWSAGPLSMQRTYI